MMNEKEAFEACREKDPYDIWRAAIEWARTQQEPVAWQNTKNGFICKERTAEYQIPLYTAPFIPSGWKIVPDQFTLMDAVRQHGAKMTNAEIVAMLASGPQQPVKEGK